MHLAVIKSHQNTSASKSHQLQKAPWPSCTTFAQLWSEEWRGFQFLFSVYYQNTSHFRSNKFDFMFNSVISLEVWVHSLTRAAPSHIRIHGISNTSVNTSCLVPSYRKAVQFHFWLSGVSVPCSVIYFIYLHFYLKMPLSSSQHLSQRLSISCPTRANNATLMAESRTLFSSTRSTIISGLSSWLEKIDILVFALSHTLGWQLSIKLI